jgi:hypothetical protein
MSLLVAVAASRKKKNTIARTVASSPTAFCVSAVPPSTGNTSYFRRCIATVINGTPVRTFLAYMCLT